MSFCIKLNPINPDSTLLSKINSMEQAEVILSNLLQLQDEDEEKFQIPFDDVIVTLKAAISLLAN